MIRREERADHLQAKQAAKDAEAGGQAPNKGKK